MSRRRRKALRIVTALAIGAVGALLTAELGARVFAFATEGARERAWQTVGQGPARADGRVSLGHLLRPSEHEKLVYELIPGLDTTFAGVPVATDPNGFRQPAVDTKAIDADTVCIVGIGDSFMFGWGVSEPECFVRQVERKLNALPEPSPRVRVVNTGVPGYNTVMQVEMLRARGLAFRPDLVLVHFVDNDFDLPNFLLSEPDYWSLDTSFLYEYCVSMWRGRPTAALRPLAGAPMDQNHHPIGVDDLARVPERYRGMVGFGPFAAALRDLREMADAHGFRVVVSALHDPGPRARALYDELGFGFVDGTAAVEHFRQTHGLSTAELQLAAYDPHPTAAVHRVLADAIVAKLVDAGLLVRSGVADAPVPTKVPAAAELAAPGEPKK